MSIMMIQSAVHMFDQGQIKVKVKVQGLTLFDLLCVCFIILEGLVTFQNDLL